MVYSADRSKAVVRVLVLLFVALWFIPRGDLFYVLPCVILFLCFAVHIALRLLSLGKRDLVLVLLVRLFDLPLFGFVCFLFLLCLRRAADCDCGTPWTFLLPPFSRCMYCLYTGRNIINNMASVCSRIRKLLTCHITYTIRPFFGLLRPDNPKPALDEPPSYDMNVATKEWNIAEKHSHLSWDSNPECPDKNSMF